jgi:GTP-binding protein
MFRLVSRLQQGPPSLKVSRIGRCWESSARFGLNQAASDKILTVSLVGRPNTGKSTLFNRLTKNKRAIVSNIPGTTRDRAEGRGFLGGVPLKIIDTGGLDNRGAFIDDVVHQVDRALVQSDVILFLLDSRTGITSTDRKFAGWIRERVAHLQEERAQRYSTFPTKIILIANKAEGAHQSDYVIDVVSDSYSLGFGEPMLISASHGDGMGDLAQSLLNCARESGCDDGELSESYNGKRKERQILREVRRNYPELLTKDVLENLKDNVNHGDVESPDLSISSKETLSIDDEIASMKTDETMSIPKPKTIEIAIMGKPNVGKSTLLNALVGEDRVITGPTPGLTRDSIYVEWNFSNRPFRLVDTAGLTHLRPSEQLLTGVKERQHMTLVDALGKDAANQKISLPGIRDVDIEEDPSQFSAQIAEFALMSALQSLKFANVVMLVVEASQGKFSKIDLQLARKCLEEGRGLFIAANKVDTLQSQGMSLTQYENQVKEHTSELFREFGKVPVVACSGTTGRSLDRLLRTAIKVHDSWDKRISTGLLNAWLREVSVTAPKARVGDKQLKVKYITQVKSRPPTFSLFCNAEELPSFYERYLRAKIQEEFQLEGVPIRFVVKKSEGNDVKVHLLKQGKHTRRGAGRGESKGKLGKNGKRNTRSVEYYANNGKSNVEERRRRDTRLRKKRNTSR